MLEKNIKREIMMSQNKSPKVKYCKILFLII